MTDQRIQKLIAQFGSTKSLERETAWSELKPLGAEVVRHLANAYPEMKKAQARISCVFYSTKYARTSESAFQLGIAALSDRATLVRYRACGLLAYSLRQDAISHLKTLLKHDDSETAADARAAIDAIERKNHHLFIDRNHSGSTFWEVNPGDVK
jgi:HEAT repeat protein